MTAEKICDHLKPEIRKKPDVVIIHDGTNGLTNNRKLLENYKRMAYSVRSKLANCKLAISNVITRKDKNEIDEKVERSKIDESFLKSEIALEGFKKPYRLDVTASSGGLLIYVKASLPSKTINHYDFQKDIQCIVMELNVANKKCVIVSIYRPAKQNINYFLSSLSEGLDFYSKHYDNICILGDFNATLLNLHLKFKKC